MPSKPDPILGELLRSQLSAAVDDMGQVLSRNAVSGEIVWERDYANGVVLDRGEVVLLDNLLHLGAASATAAVIEDMFRFAMKPGDVILSNDPYSGGTHVQDFTLLTPFFEEREQICFLLCRAHLPDLGGQAPGGYYPFADDVWAEGSRIPPLKIAQEGKIVGDKLDAVLINSRCPGAFRTNLQAMLAALETGGARLQAMLAKHGKERLQEGLRHCLSAAELQLQSNLQGWPEGTYEGVSLLDHDAKGGTDLAVRVRLRVGEKIVVDLTQSAPQSTGFVNSSRANTVSCALVPFYALLGGAVPVNSALLHAVEIVTTEGTLVHPRFPAAVGWGPFHVGAEIVSAVAQALGQVFPERAAVLAPKLLMLRARWPEQPIAFPLHTFFQGGAPGACGADGWGLPGPYSRGVLPSVEMVESHSPVLLRKLELLPDSAGAGKWRGGFGTTAEFEFRGQVFLDVLVQGQVHTSEPLAGGRPGSPNSVIREGLGPTQFLAWDCDVSSQVVAVQMGGGAGWGPPAEREWAAVAQDVENELLSLDYVPRNHPEGGAAPALAGQQEQP